MKLICHVTAVAPACTFFKSLIRHAIALRRNRPKPLVDSIPPTTHTRRAYTSQLGAAPGSRHYTMSQPHSTRLNSLSLPVFFPPRARALRQGAFVKNAYGYAQPARTDSGTSALATPQRHCRRELMTAPFRAIVLHLHDTVPRTGSH